jgi:hypothetical protein
MARTASEFPHGASLPGNASSACVRIQHMPDSRYSVPQVAGAQSFRIAGQSLCSVFVLDLLHVLSRRPRMRPFARSRPVAMSAGGDQFWRGACSIVVTDATNRSSIETDRTRSSFPRSAAWDAVTAPCTSSAKTCRYFRACTHRVAKPTIFYRAAPIRPTSSNL